MLEYGRKYCEVRKALSIPQADDRFLKRGGEALFRVYTQRV